LNSNFLALPQVILPKVKRCSRQGEPYIDYSKSIWITQEDYVKSLEQIANQKEAAAQEKERKRLEGEEMKVKKAAEKRQKEIARLEKQTMLISEKRHQAAWSAKAISEYGDKLHLLIKHHKYMPSSRSPYCGFPPPICKENQRRALERRRARKARLGTSHLLPLLEVTKPWHQPFANPASFAHNFDRAGGLFPTSFAGHHPVQYPLSQRFEFYR